jgi:hypothetical protein
MIRMEISNKTLAWLVVAAIVVSVFGTTISLWNLNNKENFVGYATSNTSGIASVDVSQSVILRFAINATNFGSGSVDGAYNNCTLSINGSSTIHRTLGCLFFNPTSTFGDSLILENAGTSFLNITINVSKNATTFLGGNWSLARLAYAVSNNETGSCLGMNNMTWSEVTVAQVLQNMVICNNLSYADDKDSIRIGINITIPQDVPQGAKAVTFLAQGTNLP